MSALISIISAVAGRDAPVRYEKSTKGSFWFITKGVILTLLTVGIYRFWFATAVRKNLWARAFIDGSPAEYTGKAHELLLGFLVALVILLPGYILVFVVTMYLPYPKLGFVVAYLLLFLFVQFARYRARRYLASRTVWRGIRFWQDGSALRYTARAAGWWLVTLLTFGMAYPFMRASLERYRMNHTLLGTTRFTSEADGLTVLPCWMIVWALSILPGLGCVVVLLAASNFKVPLHIFAGDSALAILLSAYLYYSSRLSTTGIQAVIFIFVAALVLWPFLRPYYQGREARSFLSAIRLQGARINSRFSVTDVYINYFKFYIPLIALLILYIFAILAFQFVFEKFQVSIENTTFAISILLPIIYIVFILVISWLNFRFLQVGRFSIIAKTLSIEGADALEAVTASTRKVDGMLAEGMADAVDPGAIEIGF